MNFNKARTIIYLTATLALSIWMGLWLGWVMFFAWGFLMAAWEQPTHHWARSIFKKWGLPQERFDSTISWVAKTKVFGKEIPWDDAFHISKTASIGLVCFLPAIPGSYPWYVCLALGWVATESFNLFYNYLLDTSQ